MPLPWLRDRHRHELLAQPFPEEWYGYLNTNVLFYETLTPEEQAHVRDDLRLLIAEKNWEGCAGLEMTPEIQVTVAAQACLLLLGLDIDQYAKVESILVYPAGYVAPRFTPLSNPLFPLYVETPQPLQGQANSQGTLILSWDAVLAGGRHVHSGHNLVFHEFAHVLDFRDGASDGVPRLRSETEYDAWAQVMSAEYQALVDASHEGQTTLLDPYGATDGAEFFAVATEAFFGKAGEMQQTHPQLYDVLRAYYRQDPAARALSPSGSV